MSKKDNFDDSNEEGSKGIGIIIVILIIISFLSIMALLIKCDVGGFGSEVLRPIFKNVPVIKEILPPASDEEIAKESDYPYDDLESALAQIEVMEQTASASDATIAVLSDQIAEKDSEIARLSQYETERTTYEEEKNNFYNEIVYGESAPDVDKYTEWYELIDAENAERIYKEIVEAKQADQEILDLAAAYESMDAKNAATILEAMDDDMDSVVLIMNNMSTEAQGKVLAEMSADFAASVTRRLIP